MTPPASPLPHYSQSCTGQSVPPPFSPNLALSGGIHMSTDDECSHTKRGSPLPVFFPCRIEHRSINQGSNFIPRRCLSPAPPLSRRRKPTRYPSHPDIPCHTSANPKINHHVWVCRSAKSQAKNSCCVVTQPTWRGVDPGEQTRTRADKNVRLIARTEYSKKGATAA